MKVLVSEPGRLVVQLTRRERDEMRAVLQCHGRVPRRGPAITRGSGEGLPSDATAMLAEQVAEGWESERAGTLGLLEDAARCVKGKGGYGLQVTEDEAERLLRALNGARLAFWEALGSPDFEVGERVEGTERNRALVALMELAGSYVGRWLACLGGGKEPGAEGEEEHPEGEGEGS